MEIQPSQVPPVVPVATVGMSVGAKLAIGVVAVVVLGGGGYYGYAKFTDSKPVTDSKPEVAKTTEQMPTASEISVTKDQYELSQITFKVAVKDILAHKNLMITANKAGTDIIEVTLRGILFDPLKRLPLIARSEVRRDTPIDAAVSMRSALKAADGVWLLDGIHSNSKEGWVDVYADQSRLDAAAGANKEQTLNVRAMIFDGDLAMVVTKREDPDSPITDGSYVFEPENGEWKVSDRAQKHDIFKVVSAALRSGEVSISLLQSNLIEIPEGAKMTLFRIKVSDYKLLYPYTKNKLLAGKLPDDYVEVTLPHQVFDPFLQLSPINRAEARWDTPVNAGLAYFSAEKANDIDWMIEGVEEKNRPEFRDFLKSLPDRSNDKYELGSEYKVTGVIYHDNFAKIYWITSDNKLETDYLVKTSDGWKLSLDSGEDDYLKIAKFAILKGQVIYK